MAFSGLLLLSIQYVQKNQHIRSKIPGYRLAFRVSGWSARHRDPSTVGDPGLSTWKHQHIEQALVI